MRMPMLGAGLGLWSGDLDAGADGLCRVQLVFTKENGASLKPDWLNRRFHQLVRHAGLPPGVRVYDLRHGWATAALRAGVHPKLVQEVMRHSSYTTTADTYSHVLPAHSAEAVSRVAQLFRQPKDGR
jgi:integrase